jgi:hypothetical protein
VLSVSTPCKHTLHVAHIICGRAEGQ